MERRYYNLVIKIVINLFVVCAFYQCTPTPPQFEEMIGIWRADDGATIELRADSTLVIKNIDSYFLVSPTDIDTIKTRLDAEGKWKMGVHYQGNFILSMNIKYCIRSRDSLSLLNEQKWVFKNYNRSIYIMGDNGFFNNQAPWFIRLIDSIDLYNTYDFRRVE